MIFKDRHHCLSNRANSNAALPCTEKFAGSFLRSLKSNCVDIGAKSHNSV